jgi:hypothetical protein
MNGKIYRTRASTAAIAAALLLAMPILLLITPALAQTISLSPASGPPGTSVTITGSGFSASATGVVWFDIFNNGVLDPGEPSVLVTTDGGGDIPAGVSLTVPDVPARFV